MTTQDREPVGTPEKDPADWTTGDEPVTGPQAPTCRRSHTRLVVRCPRG